MSRYIDADALPRHGQRGGLVHWKDIEGAPSIDIEPKRGEWVEWIDCEGEVFWKCSACGQVSEASAAGILYKFCPFCGARMKGVDDE